MAINAQSGCGKIRLFNDFFGVSNYLTLGADTGPAKDFYLGGFAFADNDAGASYLQSNALGGVIKLTSGNIDQDMTFIGTDICFDVGLMAPIVIEARVRFVDLDDKAAFIGLTSILTLNAQMSDIIDRGGNTTTTLTAELCGFHLSSKYTDDQDWHGVYKGGTTTGETTSTNTDLDADAVAGKWQILRLEVAPNGTAEWFIDGVLEQTVKGAISTSTDLAVVCGVGANTTEFAIMDVDYLLVTTNRDWNA